MRSELLDRFPGLVYGISNVDDGNMSFVYGEETEVRNNRLNFFDKLGIRAEDLAAIRLGMTDRVESLGLNDKARNVLKPADIEHSDAAISTEVGLFILTADCTPAIVYDPVSKAIALIHMSWQCTDKELARKTIELMQREYHCQPADLVVFMGPGIKKETYIQKNPGQKSDDRWKPFLNLVGENEYQVDVTGFNRYQLMSLGVKPENIEESPIDTATDKNFYSHYRSAHTGEPEGRFATVVMMNAN